MGINPALSFIFSQNGSFNRTPIVFTLPPLSDSLVDIIHLSLNLSNTFDKSDSINYNNTYNRQSKKANLWIGVRLAFLERIAICIAVRILVYSEFFPMSRLEANMASSDLQQRIKEHLRLLLNGFLIEENFYPDWLTNPETGYKLELDFWIPEIDMGVEVQGRQHIEYIPYFHQTKEDFEAQLQRDKVKKDLCRRQGILLYEVFDYEDINGFLDVAALHYPDISRQLAFKYHAILTLCYYAARLDEIKGKQWERQQARVIKYTNRMIAMAEEYKIPLAMIRPDYSISKMHLAFAGKPIAKVRIAEENGDTIRWFKAAIMWVKNDNSAKLVWRNSKAKIRADEPHEQAIFNLDTGLVLEGAETEFGRYWEIKLEKLPDLSLYPHIFVKEESEDSDD